MTTFLSPWIQFINWAYLRWPGHLLNVLNKLHLHPVSKGLFLVKKQNLLTWQNIDQKKKATISANRHDKDMLSSCSENSQVEPTKGSPAVTMRVILEVIRKSIFFLRIFTKFVGKILGKVSRCIRLMAEIHGQLLWWWRQSSATLFLLFTKHIHL